MRALTRGSSRDPQSGVSGKIGSRGLRANRAMSKKKSSRHGDETGRSARHRVSKLASAIAKRELAKARTLLASLVAEPAAAESLRSQLRAKPHRGIAEGDTLLHLAVKSLRTARGPGEHPCAVLQVRVRFRVLGLRV